MNLLSKTIVGAFLVAASGCGAPRADDCGCQDTGASGYAPVTETVTEAKPAAYYVEVDLRQSHFTLDIFEHISDDMNAAQFPLPTSYRLYQDLHRGDNLVDEFRSGSFWINGSIGDTEMKVLDVPAVAEGADQTAYLVTFRLQQDRFSLDLSQHLKDAANAIDFKWEVPGNVYSQMNVGDDVIQDGFRAGSFFIKGSVGSWALKVKEKNGPAPAR